MTPSARSSAARTSCSERARQPPRSGWRERPARLVAGPRPAPASPPAGAARRRRDPGARRQRSARALPDASRTPNAADEVALVQAEAKGNLAGHARRSSTAAARARRVVATAKADASDPRLRRSGAVKILQLESPTAYSLSGATGRTRLAWTVIGTLPVVQCVEVRRTGNFLAGIHVQLLGLSAPIADEGRCTRHDARSKRKKKKKQKRPNGERWNDERRLLESALAHGQHDDQAERQQPRRRRLARGAPPAPQRARARRALRRRRRAARLRRGRARAASGARRLRRGARPERRRQESDAGGAQGGPAPPGARRDDPRGPAAREPQRGDQRGRAAGARRASTTRRASRKAACSSRSRAS